MTTFLASSTITASRKIILCGVGVGKHHHRHLLQRVRSGRGRTHSSRRCFQYYYFTTSTKTTNTDEKESTSSLLDMAYGPVNAFQMNQYVIACKETKEAAIIDCGASTNQELNSFLEWISNKQYVLQAIWQTHAHLDHIAGLGLLYKSLQDKKVPIHLHEREKSLYEEYNTAKSMWGFTVEGNDPMPIANELQYFNDEQPRQLTLGSLKFDIISTPGHSPGHVGFYESTSKSFFGGDLIMQGSIGRTDFPASNHSHMMESLKHICTTLDPTTTIYPGHGSPTTLQHELQYNPFLQEFRRK